MDNNLLMLISGALLSLGFAYIPKAREWFDKLIPQYKALTMLVLMLVGAVGVFLASCYTPWQAVTCDEAGFWGLVELFVYGIIANQAAYQIGVRPVKHNS